MSANVIRANQAEAWDDCVNLIHTICHSYREQGPFNYEDLFDEATQAFFVAWEKYRDDRGAAFVSWVGTKVFRRLQDFGRAKWNVRREDLGGEECYAVPEPPKEYHPPDHLSPDGIYLASIVLDPPPDIALAFRSKASDSMGQYRQAIREYLTDLGWTRSRISTAFHEVQEAL